MSEIRLTRNRDVAQDMDVWVLRIPNIVLENVELDEFERGEVDSCFREGAEIHEILIALEIICRRFYEKQQGNLARRRDTTDSMVTAGLAADEVERLTNLINRGGTPPQQGERISITPADVERTIESNLAAQRAEEELRERQHRMAALAASYNIDVHALRPPELVMLDMVAQSGGSWSVGQRARLVALLRARNEAINAGHLTAFVEIMQSIGRLIECAAPVDALQRIVREQSQPIEEEISNDQPPPAAEPTTLIPHPTGLSRAEDLEAYVRYLVRDDLGLQNLDTTFTERQELYRRRRLLIVAEERGSGAAAVEGFRRGYVSTLRSVRANANRRRAYRGVPENPDRDGT